MRIAYFGEPKKNKHKPMFAEILAQDVSQIVKFQVGIISLDTFYCKSIVKIKSPVDP